MARIFCVLLAVLCLSACGSSGTDADAAPPQAIPLEQESDATESDAQASADAESDAAPEIAEEAEPGQKEPPMAADAEEPSAGGSTASDGTGYSNPEQIGQSIPPEAAPSSPEASSGNTEPAETGSSQEESTLKITVGGHDLLATFADNSSAEEFRALLAQGPLTIEMEDYGGFEKVGPLGTTLTRNDSQITTEPGDVILYQGNQITIYYGTNSWSFTRLARINDPSGLQEKLGEGTVSVTFSLI